MNRKALFIGAAVLLLLGFVGATLVYQSEKGQQSAQTAERNQDRLARFYAPTLGSPDAKVHIVEFLDPACETCRSFYPHVKQIIAAHPDRIRLSVRHVPFHDGSEQVVKMLEATKRQGKYWAALEAVLRAQRVWVVDHRAHPDRVWPALDGLGLDIGQLKADMNAPEIAQRIAQDLDDAKALNVTKTPEFFVNGRPLPSFGLEQLQGLVQDALRTAY